MLMPNAVITSTSSAPINATNIAATATNQLNNRADGFIGGGQFGYNYQFSPAFVAGFEADIQGTTPHSARSAWLASNPGLSLVRHGRACLRWREIEHIN
jgi:hypothetical protein